jgi:hypothetical protein
LSTIQLLRKVSMKPTTPTASKMGTVAVVLADATDTDSWIETFSDDREIRMLEKAIAEGHHFPLQKVYEYRQNVEKEDEEFGDYVENLLSKQFVRHEIQEHGVAWLKSKAKIEQFKDQEQEAAEVIANYALNKYKKDPDLIDFVLAGPGVQVRVRIFKVKLAPGTATSAA